jgi:PhzF family phenazine biosynthesis protein
MAQHPFRLLNVFTVDGDPFSGNPLCVFENGQPFSAAEMQSLARQFNLSETTFILPASESAASRRVRIFTPSFEMPFAGHPTLGTAHVVRDLIGGSDSVVLEMKAGLVDVVATANDWTLRAASKPTTRTPDASRAELARMLDIDRDTLGETPLWVDTGAEQLIIPVTSPEAVRRARPSAEELDRHGFSKKRGASMAYVWAHAAPGEVVARFFFLANGGVVEDPATGSACANLGGWMIATGQSLPVRLSVRQGEAIRRPSVLQLHVDEQERIFVGGSVREVGRGSLALG